MAVGTTYLAMGNLERLAGLINPAERSYRAGLEHSVRAGAPGGPIAAGALIGLGYLDNRRGLHRRAVDECRRGLDMMDDYYRGETNFYLMEARECLAEALLGTGDVHGARLVVERAVEAVDDRDVGPQWTAGARFQLARALWATPDDRPRALALARSTLSSLAAAEGDNRELVARIERWLSTHQERAPRRELADVRAPR
jgi:hypothetical protein